MILIFEFLHSVCYTKIKKDSFNIFAVISTKLILREVKYMITESYQEMPEPLYQKNDITVIYMWHPADFSSILPHWHTRTEFIIVLEGVLNVTCGNMSKVLVKGDILFVNPHQLHAAKSGKDGVKYYALILEDNLSNGLRVKINNQYVKLFPSKVKFQSYIKDEKIYELLIEIIKEDQEKKESYELFIQAAIINVFARLYRFYIEKNDNSVYLNTNLNQILTYIEEHYYDDITTDSISKHFKYNKSHFCRIFKQYTGTSFVNYLTILRLEKAFSILKSTNKPISEIAVDVGFGSSNYFSRLFYKYYGKRPSEIKKNK